MPGERSESDGGGRRASDTMAKSVTPTSPSASLRSAPPPQGGGGKATRDDFAFFHLLRVRWAEVDAQGIVFNPNYFLYFDVGMTEYTRAIGYSYPQQMRAMGTDLYAVNANANFMGSALYDDMLDIAVRVSRIGRSSFSFAMAVFRGDALLVEGSLTYVHATIDTRNSTPLPEDYVSRILAFERTPPEQKASAPAV